MDFVHVILLLIVADGVAQGQSTVDCTQWNAGTQVTVNVADHVVFDASCNPYLRSVPGVTLACAPGAAVDIDGWVTNGAFLAITGPLSAPWTIANISVVVRNSMVVAVGGPAVGIVVPAPAAVLLSNVTLQSINSTLSSSVTSGSAAALGVAVGYQSTTSFHVVTSAINFVAVDSVLNVTSNDASAAVGVALSQYGGASLILQNATFIVTKCQGAVASTTTGMSASAFGGVALGVGGPSGTATVFLANFVVTLSGGNFTVTSKGAIASAAGGGFSVAKATTVTLTAFVVRVSGTNLSVQATDSLDVAASTAGLATAYILNRVVVNNFDVFVSDGSQLFVRALTSTTSYAASGIASVAIAYAPQGVSVTQVALRLEATQVAIACSGGMAAATAVASCTVAQAGAATVANGLMWVNKSTVTTSCTSLMASCATGVAAVALSRVNPGVALAHLALGVNGTTTQSATTTLIDSASAVAGVAIAFTTGGDVSIRGVSMYIQHAQLIASDAAGVSVGAFLTLSFGGVALAKVSSGNAIIANMTSFIGWAHAKGNVVATYDVAGAVGGIAAGYIDSGSLTCDSVTSYVYCSVVDLAVRSRSTSYAAAAVASIAGAYIFNALVVTNATLVSSLSSTDGRIPQAQVGALAVSGVAVSTCARVALHLLVMSLDHGGNQSVANTISGRYAATVVVGFAATSVTSVISVNSVTCILFAANVSASTIANADAASAIGGIALGTIPSAPSPLLVSGIVIAMANGSGVSSTTASSLGQNAASVGGISSAASLLPVNVTSIVDSLVASACATLTAHHQVACGDTSTTTLPCCYLYVAGNGTASSWDADIVPRIVVPSFFPPWSDGVPLRGRTRSKTAAVATRTLTLRLGPHHTRTHSGPRRVKQHTTTHSLLVKEVKGTDPLTTTTAPTATAAPTPHQNRTRTVLRSPRVENVTSPAPQQMVTTVVSPTTTVDPRELGLGSTVTTAVVNAGYGSSVIASALSPTSGNKATVTSRVSTASTCASISSATATEPSSLTLMPAVVNLTTTAASMVLTTLVLNSVVLILGTSRVITS